MSEHVPTNVVEFAIWLALNGLTIAVLLEQFSFWKNLDSGVKRIAVFALTFSMPFVSNALVAILNSLSPEVLSTVQHYIDLGATGLRIWAMSQYAHSIDPSKVRQLLEERLDSVRDDADEDEDEDEEVDGVPSAG